jgi:hypothetical protein
MTNVVFSNGGKIRLLRGSGRKDLIFYTFKVNFFKNGFPALLFYYAETTLLSLHRHSLLLSHPPINCAFTRFIAPSPALLLLHLLYCSFTCFIALSPALLLCYSFTAPFAGA